MIVDRDRSIAIFVLLVLLIANLSSTANFFRGLSMRIQNIQIRNSRLILIISASRAEVAYILPCVRTQQPFSG